MGILHLVRLGKFAFGLSLTRSLLVKVSSKLSRVGLWQLFTHLPFCQTDESPVVQMTTRFASLGSVKTDPLRQHVLFSDNKFNDHFGLFGCLITVCLHVHVRLEKFGEQNDGFVRFWHI